MAQVGKDSFGAALVNHIGQSLLAEQVNLIIICMTLKALLAIGLCCASQMLAASGAGAERSTRIAAAQSMPPYPPSRAIKRINWHWDTLTFAAPGSDLWPVTCGPDGLLYAAWGDGGGFGGSDSDGRVAMGFARINGDPYHWSGVNVNGGKHPEHPATFPKAGKTSGIAFIDDALYASVNLQDGIWPDVNHVLVWSTNRGADWTRAGWLFARGNGHFHPATFVNFGTNAAAGPGALAGFVYLCGPKQNPDPGNGNRLYLARVSKDSLHKLGAYEFVRGIDGKGNALWTPEARQAEAIFTDLNGVTHGSIIYLPMLKRFVLTCFHVGPGQLGVFDAPKPWGPWTTVEYYEDWGGMGAEGEGLTCSFPLKWASADGLTLWSMFSVYGEGAKRGIKAHDRLNLVKATLEVIALHP